MRIESTEFSNGLAPSKFGLARMASFAGLVVFGAAACWIAVLLIDKDTVTPGVLFSVLLLGIPALVGGTFGFREAIRVFSDFRPKIQWWHWFWFLTLFSSFVFRAPRTQAQISAEPLDAVAALRIVPEVIVAAGLLLRLVFRRPDWLPSLFRGLVGALSIFALVCLVSSIWSVNFSWTFYKSWEYLVDVSVLAVILATVESSATFKTLIDWTWMIFGLELIWIWIGLPIWPVETMEREGHRLTGAYPIVSANEIGEFGAILMLVALIRFKPLHGSCKNRAFYVFTFLLGFASLFASETRSAMAGLAVAVVLVCIFSGRTKIAALIGLLSTPLIFFTGLGAFIWQFLEREQSESELLSLSSRLQWWGDALHAFMQHPFTGLGAYAGSRFAVMAKVSDVPSLHSDYIEVLVGTSIWGLLPLLVSLLGTWVILVFYLRYRSLDPPDRQLAIEIVGVLAIVTVHSFFNQELTWHAPTLYLLVLGYAEFLRRKLARRRREFLSPSLLWAQQPL